MAARYYDDPLPRSLVHVTQPGGFTQPRSQLLLRPESGTDSKTAFEAKLCTQGLCDLSVSVYLPVSLLISPSVKSFSDLISWQSIWLKKARIILFSSLVTPFAQTEGDKSLTFPPLFNLQMPYMDWEKDRKRKLISSVTANESVKFQLKQENCALRTKHQRIAHRAGMRHKGKRVKGVTQSVPEFRVDLGAAAPLERTLTGFLRRAAVIVTRETVEVDENGRLTVRSALGQYLIGAARLYEGMLTLQDRVTVERYLYNYPPLHPRRTLDQYRHPSLVSTEARDRDQVVHRGTSDRPELRHRLRISSPITQKRGRAAAILGWLIPRKPWRRGKDDMDGTHPRPLWTWDGHLAETDERGCDYCTNGIKKTSKLIMVDQLWMWILDEQTIITSFPGRYGDDQHLNGIHKSIRDRLKNADVRSVFDIALVVLTECSTAFLDRTRIDVSRLDAV